MVTYNHEQYIRQAIDSVLMQRTPFSYEIVVGDDCSTDATREIVSEYGIRYPDVVRPILHRKNVGMQRNVIDCLHACRGRYGAWLDGDDFWLAEDKLTTQVSSLEQYPECVGSFGRARVFYEDESRDAWEYPDTIQRFFTLEQILRENVVPSCTVMFRLGLLLEIPSWFLETPYVDWALYLQLTQHGSMVLTPRTLSAYRVHRGGVYSRLDRGGIRHNNLVFYRLLERYLPPKYRPMVLKKMSAEADVQSA
jgi:glycosyltransferase involved in cell wall biosynthesis